MLKNLWKILKYGLVSFALAKDKNDTSELKRLSIAGAIGIALGSIAITLVFLDSQR